MSTGYIWHERFGFHDTGTAAGWMQPGGFVQPLRHLESPESKQRLAALIAVSGLDVHLTRLAPRETTDEELLRVHSRAHLDHVAAASDAPRGGLCEDGFSPIGPGSDGVARLAAGAAIVAVDAVMSGDVDNAYVLSRPPGHHATRHQGQGFCIYNNMAVAIAHARAELGVGRIAVVDWDVHHGNGTQDLFYDDGDVLTISIHQNGLFPSDTGHITEVGEGAGAGANINVPLPAGSGGDAYRAAVGEVALAAVERFAPDLVVVGCGYDASMYDPMARQMLTASTFRDLMTMTMATAAGVCDGRLVAVHEGGYSPEYVPFCGIAVLEQLCGHRTEVVDPFERTVLRIPGQEMTVLQRASIDAARDVMSL